MNMTDRIWWLKETKRSDDYLEFQTIKEYLIKEIDKIRKEKELAEKQVDSVKISSYLINIITRKLNERIELFEHLLTEVQARIKEDDDGRKLQKA